MMGTRQKLNGMEFDRLYGRQWLVWNHRKGRDVKPRLRRRLRHIRKMELRKDVADGRRWSP